MNLLSRVYLLTGILFLMSCNTKKVIEPVQDYEEMEEITFEPIDIYPDSIELDSLPKVFRPSATMSYDIIHTKLDLRFDWIKRHVLGKADLMIKPFFRPIDSLILDAVGFDIHQVALTDNKTLAYRYDGANLTIILDKTYTRTDTFRLNITYTAKPDENPITGSEAITSNKGLFFINPTGSNPDLPTQIWTQGETEHNSRWFPTFDKPNERFSQEIILTVNDKFKTLSNGKLISSNKNADGTRTDHWKQEKAHAPYLAMIAVGDFHVETEYWNDIPLTYMVDKNYGKYAKKIFNHTPEMLAFFSNLLKYPYPWDKYSQVVVHEFVSGAMENTGAVVFGDFVQKTDKELAIENNDDIVAHELFHHWFGDLVTCEDWSNLVLNEGFASYAEYLWAEHKYGRTHAEYKRWIDIQTYFQENYFGRTRPVVHYYYDDKEEMFDRHSYEKGGLILHMLRNYIGDDAFFTALNSYLTKHAGSAVEIAELRMAFEDTIGEDLNWFFDQWFIGQGQPHIHITYTYDSLNHTLRIQTDQSETPDHFSYPFKLPTDVVIYHADGRVTYHPITITETIQEFVLNNINHKPLNYILNSNGDLLMIKSESGKSDTEYIHQVNHVSNFEEKISAIRNIKDQEKLIPILLNDSFYIWRSTAIELIEDTNSDNYIDKLQDMALSDHNEIVRRSAYYKLLNFDSFDPMLLTHLILKSEKSYPMLEIALNVIGIYEPASYKQYFDMFKNEESDYLVTMLVSMMPDDSQEYLEYAAQKARTIDLRYAAGFFEGYKDFTLSKGLKAIEHAIDSNLTIADPTNGSPVRKLHAMNFMLNLCNELIEMTDNVDAQILLDSSLFKIKAIALAETDPDLIESPIYNGFRE